jgi:hypothetical protein
VVYRRVEVGTGERMSDHDQADDEKSLPKPQAQTPYFGFAGTGAEGFNSGPFYSGQPLAVPAALIGSLGLNEVTLDSPPVIENTVQGIGVGDTLTVTLLREDKFAKMAQRVAALEKALANITVPQLPGIGHNDPPEPIDRLPLTPKKRRRLKASIATVKAEVKRPRRNRNKVLAAARRLKPILKTLASFCKKQAANFTRVSVGAAALTAGPLWGNDIHQVSIDAIQEVCLKLSDLIHAVEGWASIAAKLL